MEQVVFTHKEASLVAAIESESEFSLSQAAIWTNMGPAEVRELLTGLESRGWVRHSEGGRYAFTKEGLFAKRQLSQRSNKNIWICEDGKPLDSASVDSALGDAISRLK